MKIKAVFRFRPFSKKQRKVLNWWCRSSPVRDYNGIIADGAIRSGKSVAMSLGFVIWAMSEFSACNFAMCGKTIGSFRRNVLFWLKLMLRSRGYSVSEQRTENLVIVRRGDTENYFYVFGGKDERSQAQCRAPSIWCDSAETVLIKGIRTEVFARRIPVEVRNARKGEIIDRIRLCDWLMSQGRFFILRRCRHTIAALSEAVWDSKSPTKDRRLDDGTLNANGFWKQLPELLSKSYAMGGVLKCYLSDGKPRIDYITADRFVPVSWDGSGVHSGILSGTYTRGRDYYHLLEFMRPGRSEFRLFKATSDAEVGRECPLAEMFPDLQNPVEYEGGAPVFAYFRPFVSNNSDYDTPLGMSVYANCTDTLRALDTVFDSFQREFILGKKRIIVPSSCVQTIIDPEKAEPVRYFDADDEAFIALRHEDGENLKITDNTTELRIEQHVSAINAYLNILCMQTGLSAGTFSFDVQQGMKTATEIISQESKTARTVKNNKNLLTEAIETVVHALVQLGVMSGEFPAREYSVTVGWNDNIIIDDNTLIDNKIKLVSAGLKSKVKAIMEVQKCDEATAREELARMSQETGGGDIADFFGNE